jgi:hypothetical protein
MSMSYRIESFTDKALIVMKTIFTGSFYQVFSLI